MKMVRDLKITGIRHQSKLAGQFGIFTKIFGMQNVRDLHRVRCVGIFGKLDAVIVRIHKSAERNAVGAGQGKFSSSLLSTKNGNVNRFRKHVNLRGLCIHDSLRQLCDLAFHFFSFPTSQAHLLQLSAQSGGSCP